MGAAGTVTNCTVFKGAESGLASVRGLTWASSDPTIVSLSTNDPPILTALAAGHVTITAGTGSADVTVSTVLPLGVFIEMQQIFIDNR